MALNQTIEADKTANVLVAGYPFKTAVITIKSGEAAEMKMGTPMILDASPDVTTGVPYHSTGKYVQFNPGTEYASQSSIKHEHIGFHAILAADAEDPTGGDVQCLAYVMGTFNEVEVFAKVGGVDADALTSGEKTLVKSVSATNGIYLVPVETVY